MRYQKIESRIWNDEKFIQLTPLQQRLFLYILTCPHGNLIGLYVLKKGYVIEDLKVLSKDFERDLKAVLKTGMVEYDEMLGVMWVKNFLKHNPLTNPNQKKAVPRILVELPKSYLIQEFIKEYESTYEVLSKDLKRTFEGNPKPDSDTDTDSDTELDTSCGFSQTHGVGRNGNIPYSEIQKAFNEILTDLPSFRDLTEPRRKALKARWHTDDKTCHLEWWTEQFFPLIAESEFLTGRNGKWTSCNIDWILKQANFQKIREGTYNR